eukprot:scaffold618_cov130-Cylindrotheca_fusiformis.AAC.28
MLDSPPKCKQWMAFIFGGDRWLSTSCCQAPDVVLTSRQLDTSHVQWLSGIVATTHSRHQGTFKIRKMGATRKQYEMYMQYFGAESSNDNHRHKRKRAFYLIVVAWRFSKTEY